MSAAASARGNRQAPDRPVSAKHRIGDRQSKRRKPIHEAKEKDEWEPPDRIEGASCGQRIPPGFGLAHFSALGGFTPVACVMNIRQHLTCFVSQSVAAHLSSRERFKQVLFHPFQMASWPINPSAAGAAVKRIVQPVYKVGYSPLHLLLADGPKFLVAPEAPGKIAVGFGFHSEFGQNLASLLLRIIGDDHKDLNADLFLFDPSASCQQNPSLGSRLLGSLQEFSLSPVRNIQTQQPEFFGQFPHGSISQEFHLVRILFLFARPVKNSLETLLRG